ncbi:MAG: adenylate/guanylate cyclase domain-containing protein, partial [Calditrichaeota bacterium]|nr:adenylate/guanylate cyclase domain-containing protein [Calditrichota bacterium]
PLDLIVVKGKRKPVQVYELIARKDEQLHHLLASILPMYEEGMAYYEARNWEKAADRFSSILRLMPDDGPSKLYLRRSQEFALSPPPLDWDGVYQMQSK